MAVPSSVPRLPYETIRTQADDFLRKYHAVGTVPVPIEEIVEFRLRLDIVPVPGLRHAFEIDGFTTGDGREIHVDEYAQENFPARYRFTLAHEVGHTVLHPWAYGSERFSTIDGWRKFVNSLPEEDAGRLEFQANCFAGLVLVPAEPLAREVDAAVRKITAYGANLTSMWDEAWTRIESVVAQPFEVSAEVAHRRVEFDGLRDRYRSR